jgi:hypothetical protein
MVKRVWWGWVLGNLDIMCSRPNICQILRNLLADSIQTGVYCSCTSLGGSSLMQLVYLRHSSILQYKPQMTYLYSGLKLYSSTYHTQQNPPSHLTHPPPNIHSTVKSYPSISRTTPPPQPPQITQIQIPRSHVIPLHPPT